VPSSLQRRLGAGVVALTLLAALFAIAPGYAQAAPGDPIFVFTPHPPPLPPIVPPPNGYLNGPCGLAVDSNGRLYVSDHYHDVIDVFNSGLSYVTQHADGDPLGGPCGLALDSSDRLYVNDYHRGVTKLGAPSALDSSQPTGVAVDPTSGHVFVDDRTHIAEYDSSGSLVRQIGAAGLGEGYGVAVSSFPGEPPLPSTAGYLYVADAEDDTVKAYDPSVDTEDPVATIDGAALPGGGFSSLRDAALAVDRVSGDVYVVDDTQPGHAEQPRARVYVFSAAGTYLGHLKYDVVDGAPTGIAVDNSAGSTQGRVYVTSGNTHSAGIYIYAAGSATMDAPPAPTIPLPPPGGDSFFSTIPIGAATPPSGGIPCEGDACQVLPPEPIDPTLTTLLQGLGNPKPRYVRYKRRATGKRPQRHGRRHRRHKHQAKRKRENRLARRAAFSAAPAATAARPAPAASPSAPLSPAIGGATTQGLLPGAAGFDAAAYADGGEAATQAGSHPYSLELNLALDQGGGETDLRSLRIDLPPGLLVNPAATGVLCSNAAFDTPRNSPYESSQSGESCPDRTQLGTVEVTTAAGGGQTRRFGLFELNPPSGAAMRLGASPFGQPLLLDGQIRSDTSGTYFSLAAAEVPQALRAGSLKPALWGTPWDASHNAERGNCLNEADPALAWCKSSAGEPLANPPVALLTLPTECGSALSFSAQVGSWQQAGAESAAATSRDSGGDPAPLVGCSTLNFNPKPEGLLSVTKASSSSGYVFRFSDEDSGIANPRQRIHALPRKAVVELPKGVTINPSVGAGLDTCSPAQLAGETAFNPPGGGCPNGSKIGVFSVHVPFYQNALQGGIYLAKPDEPGGAPGAENPFDTLLAVYLIAKSADRGILIGVPGKLVPDPGDGTLTATFDNLPQLPYTNLEVNFRSGQRAPLVSPPACGPGRTTITFTPWAAGAPAKATTTDSPITSGIDFGPCPDGSTPPFAPDAVTGGVNSNVGSYTPYYVHLIRKDTEQEITSYSLVLPKGITGKLAGIPFCPEAAIEAARHRSGVEEEQSPSCPAASQVGRTETGYGVGAALTYAPGRVYLAGPYHGAPLSLVTINSATVGPFDLGTIVIRSAFQVDPSTAQLRIDSGASDPIPHIVDGIPLHLREVRIYMDRFQFTHNPSSCEASQLESTLNGSGATFESSADDSTATVAKHFQLLNCLTLGFHPKLGLRLRGPARRGAFPSLRASFVSRGAKDSNLKRIEVIMPHAEFLAQTHIHTVCSRVQFAAERCPAGSAYGKAVAKTLLFDEPLRGEVYLRASSNKLPDLVADLHSGAVRIEVDGRIGPGKHGIRAFFDNLPDAPIDSFTMTLFGGKRGLLQNSANICANPPVASVKGLGQNNRGAIFTTVLRGQCGKRRS
jgi:hypothetical protein